LILIFFAVVIIYYNLEEAIQQIKHKIALIIPNLTEAIKQNVIPIIHKINGKAIITVALVAFQKSAGWLPRGCV
jgi:hypothetical protein